MGMRADGARKGGGLELREMGRNGGAVGGRSCGTEGVGRVMVRGGNDVGFKGLIFCAALVALLPISMCGDTASARVANPGYVYAYTYQRMHAYSQRVSGRRG